MPVMSGGSAEQSNLESWERPWRNEKLLHRLYIEEEMSLVQISEVLDCAPNTVRKWVKDFGFEYRGQKEACQLALGHDYLTLNTSQRGYEAWWNPGHTVYVHRLLAVSKFGLDAIAGKHVHHKNGIPWDNRPENLELTTNSEHQRKHLKVEEPDRKEIADMYEHTDDSSYTIADKVDYDICSATVREIHREYYDNESE